MGNCVPASVEVIEVSDEDRRRHREVERSLKKVRIQCSHLSFFNVYIRIFRVWSCLFLTTLYFQTKQKMASQFKVRWGGFLL